MSKSASIGPALVLSLAAASAACAQDRMPPLEAQQQTAAQKAASDEFQATRKTPVFGPFTPLLRSPELMTAANHMGDYLRYRSSLPPRLSELAILIVSREWNQSVEWSIHQPVALKSGVSQSTVDAIAARTPPKSLTTEEQIVYDLLTELHRDRAVTDATYGRARAAFGEQGVVDLTGIAGYYTLLAMTMNVARTPAEAGTPVLPLEK
jgi:4-carboxymuconolactone decarboxylase